MLIYSNYMVHDTVKNWQIWRKIIENEGGWKRFFQIIRRDVIMLKRIHMRKKLLNSMCNLSQGIKERALEQGLEQGLAQGRELEVFSSVQACDYDIARGAQKLNLSVEEFEKKMVAAGYRVPKQDEVHI